MSSDPHTALAPPLGAITATNLGKRYKRYPHRWGRIAEWMTGGRLSAHEARWVLRGVSFAVEPAEAVGIVGQNGAGKSTLLKILTGTTRASEGTCAVHGRVSALLELGMGFHPDFTGRQNAVTGCQMLGLGAAEIDVRLPQIAAFAELGDSMDQPLRSYSSGMQMRLAFSVATAVRPEILIVDEALSVGDVYFQHKSMQRIRAFRDAGTTLLFVSHDAGAVKSLCTRALFLDQGRLLRDGSPDAVLDYYNALIAQREEHAAIQQVEAERGRISTRSGSGDARIRSVDITDSEDRPCRIFRIGDTAKLHCLVEFQRPIELPTIGMVIRDRLGNDVFGTNTYHLKLVEPVVGSGECLAVTFTLALNLGCGSYSVSFAAHTEDTHVDQNLDWWDQALVFQMVAKDGYAFVGTAMLPIEATMERRRQSRTASG
jgi:lipopolysaccharide transport system ATP-binding protein